MTRFQGGTVNERTIKMVEVERAISHFKETHRYDPLVILIHPKRVTVKPMKEFPRFLFSFNGVQVYEDKDVPLGDSAGEILFLLGDCIEPAIKVYADD